MQSIVLSVRCLRAGLLLIVTSGCVVDGVYSVRGTVWRSGAERTPVVGASASVPRCVPRENQTETGITKTDGRYDVTCAFGGMCFLFWCPGVGVPDTTVTFMAQGYEPRAVRLLGKESDSNVSRARCHGPDPRQCFQIDVTLEPERDRSSSQR